MHPIRDTTGLRPGHVLYHSAFGFATIRAVEPTSVVLVWETSDPSLPGRVGLDVLSRVYARCGEDGFFVRTVHAPDQAAQLVSGRPVEALVLLLGDLDGPQRRTDLVDWLVRRGLLDAASVERWWRAAAPLLDADPRIARDGDVLRLRRDETSSPAPPATLEDDALSAAARLDLALARRSDLDADAYLQHVARAWHEGSGEVRDLALKATTNHPADQVLRALLEAPRVEPDALAHALRHGPWTLDDLPPERQRGLVDVVVRHADGGGPLDSVGRLTAELVRWRLPELVPTLADLAAGADGRRLLRATLACLPSDRGEQLALDLLAIAIDDASPEAAQWLGAEALSIALLDARSMARRLDADRPRVAGWLRDRFTGPAAAPGFVDDLTDEVTAWTAEIDTGGVVEQTMTLAELPPRSGASTLGLGLALARALAHHHKEGVTTNPAATRVTLLPSETMHIEPGPPQDAPLPANEPPSPTADVYAAAILVLQCLLGRSWPAHIPPQRAIPYLRHVAPTIPPSGLAPLDAALHPDRRMRPRDGLAWQAMWQMAAISEETRGYAERDPVVTLDIGFDTHIGRSKLLRTQTNQDALFVSSKGPLSLLVVCDGISTANAGSGDIASSIATNVIGTLWEQALPRLVQAGPLEIRAFLDRALRVANQAVCEAALRLAGGSIEGRIPMGTTCVAALAFGNRVWLAWLGDSRAYLVGPYGASLLTFDENQASERLRAWHLRYTDHWDPAGFALVGYLGHFDELSRPDALPAHHASFTLCRGERLVLCSDGVTDYLGDTHPEAARLVADAARRDDPFEACWQLVQQGNRGGGGDNLTAVTARLVDR